MPSSENGKNRLSILLVDDRPENLLTLEAVLQDPHYHLLKARSGHEAIDLLARTADVAVILLDVQMPDMDGFETARMIKQDPRHRDTPILFITAISTDPANIFKGYMSGAMDYLTKPFEDYVLRAKVSVIAELFEKNQQIKQQEQALSQVNIDLHREIQDRKAAEVALRHAHDELERRVLERTAELEASNQALQGEIVERRRVEAQVKASLKEKEVLLKEIHHRVKNNLQIISSLLSLQAEEIRDASALEKFRDSQARIQSMALVHEKLYQSKDLGKIDMGAYIASLAQTLIHAQGRQNTRIRLQVEAEEQYVTLDTAIPCGLILNELLSNALKHAFPDGRAGRISVRFSKGPEHWTIVVQDDGVGFPSTFDLHQSPSLGLRIVNSLVHQLEAELTLDHTEGTTFMLAFNDIYYPSRLVTA